VDDEFLKTRIDGAELTGQCSYCDEIGSVMPLVWLADFIDIALSEFFRHADPGSDGAQPVTEIIAENAEILPEVAEDIRIVLAALGDEARTTRYGGCPFDSDAHYTRIYSVDDVDLEIDWADFERKIKTRTRYFNREAEAMLTSIFGGIDEHYTGSGRPLVMDAGPGTDLSVLYRARCFESPRDLDEAMKSPDRDLGPPPTHKAREGRMNASGISVFYGATDPATALAEVRPPVGSRVLIATFEVTRPLRLLDTDALRFMAEPKGSIFDPDHILRAKRAKFLKGLGPRIAKPVLPNDAAREYLPTQALADFLASMENPELDGIIYSSYKAAPSLRIFGGGADRRNVVLFHKSASVQKLTLPAGTEVSLYRSTDLYRGFPGHDDDVSAFVDDGPEITYSVFERVPNSQPGSEEPDSTTTDGSVLRVSSLEHRYIRGVSYDCVATQVERYRVPAEPDAAPS
jgi:hypothetical protein